jgi:hypothetical protein
MTVSIYTNQAHTVLATYLSPDQREDIALAFAILEAMPRPENWKDFDGLYKKKLSQLRQMPFSAVLRNCQAALGQHLGPWFSVVTARDQMVTLPTALSHVTTLAQAQKQNEFENLPAIIKALVQIAKNKPEFAAGFDTQWLVDFESPDVYSVGNLKKELLMFYGVKQFIKMFITYLQSASINEPFARGTRRFGPVTQLTPTEEAFQAQWAEVRRNESTKVITLIPKIKPEQRDDFVRKYIDTPHPMNAVASRIMYFYALDENDRLHKEICEDLLDAWAILHSMHSFKVFCESEAKHPLVLLYTEFNEIITPFRKKNVNPMKALDAVRAFPFKQPVGWINQKLDQVETLTALFPAIDRLYAMSYELHQRVHRLLRKKTALDWTLDRQSGDNKQLPTPVQFAEVQTASPYLDLIQEEIDESKIGHLAKKLLEIRDASDASGGIATMLLRRPKNIALWSSVDKRVNKWKQLCVEAGGWMKASWAVQRHAFPDEVDQLIGTAFSAVGTFPNSLTCHPDTSYRLRAEIFIGEKLMHKVVIQYTFGKDGKLYHRYMSKVETHINWDKIKLPVVEEMVASIKKGQTTLPNVSKGTLRFNPTDNTLTMIFAEGFSLRFYRVL